MPCKPQHATSGEILRGAARRLTATKFRAVEDDDTGGSNSNTEKKILISRNLDNVNKIWHAVALVIENSLLSAARGIRIEALGTFTLDAKDRARFFLASEFVARHRLLKYDACTGASLAGGSVNTRLNISRVAATAGRSRPEAERVLDAVLRSLRQCLASGRSVALSFHPVAEFSCVPSRESTMRYLPGFRARRKAVTTAIVRARVGVGRTKSTPTPWAAASGVTTVTDAAAAAAVAAADIASTGECRNANTSTNSRVAFVRGPAETTAVGARRSYSASTSSASHTHRTMPNRPKSSYGRGMSNRPKSSHGGGSGVIRANTVSGAGGRIQAAESDVDTTTKQPSAWESPRNDNRRIEENAGGLKTAAYDSCASLGSDVFGDDAPEGARWVSPHRGASRRTSAAVINRCNEEWHVREGGWLANLLRQQTLAQTDKEGLRRLTETLRLTHADTRGCDGRLSGRTLLEALRDVGVQLTSDQLEDMTSVFRRQRDGRVSLRALLDTMGCPSPPASYADNAPRLSPDRARGWREGGSRVGGSSPGIRRARDGRGSGTPRREGSPTPLRGRGGEYLSAASCNESRAPQGPAEMVTRVREHENRQLRCEVEKQYPDDDHRDAFRLRHGEDCPSASQHDNIADTTLVVSQVGTPAMDQPRRECWHSVRGGGSKAKAPSAEESAIAELATIVYRPPRSLEGLIHVLQASKVTEQPFIACAAMSARLCQLRPGLGKTRAKELAAAAACDRLDEKVCLVQLHALLERRFGRNGLSSAATAAEKNTPPARSGVSPSGRLSCAAVDRVRRNFLSGKGGLGGLRAALSKASVSAEGSLTKEELRRALTAAGGSGCPLPTAKNVDDLFTLFSCQTSAGVNGGRVEAATVLRSLRGDLSPSRERVVREIFQTLLNLSRRSRRAVDDDEGVAAPNGQGDDRNFSHPRRKVGMKSVMSDDVAHVEDLKNAYCGGGGNGFPPMIDNGVLVSGDRGNRSIGGWFSPRARPGDGTSRPSLAAGNGWGVGEKSASTGVTLEQFLEHYRDVSAGIDGDDAFEAFVRGSWSMHPLAHPKKPSSCVASDLGLQRTVDAVGGADDRTPRTALRRHEEDEAAGSGIPGKITRASSRTEGVSLLARDGGTSTALGYHQSISRETAVGKTAAVVHPASYSAPAVPRTGGLRRSVLTPPRARLPGGGKGHTGATNADSVRQRERRTDRSLTAARSDMGEKYQEGSSSRVEKYVEGRSARVGVGVATSQARQQITTEDGHNFRRPATHGARWAPDDKLLGDRDGSCTDRRQQAPQRQEQGQVEELNGYRIEPAGVEFEQQHAGTADFRAMVIPAAAEPDVRQQDQPSADIIPLTVRGGGGFQQLDVQRNTRVAAQNATKIVVSSSTANENRDGKRDAPARKVPPTGNKNRAGTSNALAERSEGNGGGTPFGRPAAAAIAHGGGYSCGPPFDRSAAAIRVQRVFRGHKGRRCAGAEGRKRASQRAWEREARMERERPHAASRRLAGRLPRPKLPSTYGF